jgi:hypothetical protein
LIHHLSPGLLGSAGFQPAFRSWNRADKMPALQGLVIRSGGSRAAHSLAVADVVGYV